MVLLPGSTSDAFTRGRKRHDRVARALPWLMASVVLVAGCAGDRSSRDDDPLLEELLTEASDLEPGDERAVELIESVVHEANTRDQGSDLVPPGQRAAVADRITPYIADVNNALHEGDAELSTQQGAWSLDGRADMDRTFRTHLRRLLIDLGRDEVATETILAAQLDHVRYALDHHLSDPQRSSEDRLANVRQTSTSHAEVVNALAHGVLDDDSTVAHVAAFHAGLAGRAASTTTVNEAIQSDAPEPLLDALDIPPATSLRDLDQGERDRIVGPLRTRGLSAAGDLVSAAIYSSVALDDPAHDELMPDLPDELREAKERGRAWTQEDWNLWYGYLDETPALAKVVDDAVSDHATRFPER